MSDGNYKINRNPFTWNGILGRIDFLLANIVIFIFYITPLVLFCSNAYHQVQESIIPADSPDGIAFLTLTFIYHYCVFCLFKKRILDAFSPLVFRKSDDKKLKLKENLFAGVIAFLYALFSIRSIFMLVYPIEAWFWNIVIVVLLVLKGQHTSKKDN